MIVPSFPLETESLLLYRSGGLGDLLAVLPAVRLLRARRPGCHLRLVASPGYGELFRGAGIVDAVSDSGAASWLPLFAPFAGGAAPAELGSPNAGLWAWFTREPPPAFRQNGRALFGDRFRIFVWESGSGLTVSRDLFNQTAKALDEIPSDDSFASRTRLPVPDAWIKPDARAEKTAPPAAVLHPGSGGVRKRWPLERFLEVARNLSALGRKGALVFGPAEEELAGEPARPDLPAGWTAIVRPPIEDLAGRLSRCALYLGNDSGITHLAASVGAPVVALFRDEYIGAWRPFGRSVVLHSAELEGLSVASVWRVCAGLLRQGG